MNLASTPSASRLSKRTPSMLVTLVRHGQSEGNMKQLVQGQSDYVLSELGIQQAQALENYLRENHVVFDAVYSSDLKRARQTCGIVAAGYKITDDVRLREKNYGVFENRPVSELVQAASQAGVPTAKFVSPGGESQEQIRTRGADFFHSICNAHLSDGCPRVLISSHGCFIRELLAYLFTTYTTNLKKADAHRISPNTGVTVMHVWKKSSKELVLEFLKVHNDEHLANVVSTAPPGV